MSPHIERKGPLDLLAEPLPGSSLVLVGAPADERCSIALTPSWASTLLRALRVPPVGGEGAADGQGIPTTVVGFIRVGIKKVPGSRWAGSGHEQLP